MDNKKKIKILSNKKNYYEIEMSGKEFLDMHISYLGIEQNKKFPQKRYKNIILSLEDLKLSFDLQKDIEFQNMKSFSELIYIIYENNNILELKENNNDLELVINLPKPFSSSIKINFELFNIVYYITKGPRFIRINENPFYTSLNNNFFNLEIIKSVLENDKIISIYNIDNYRYYDYNKKGFIKINEYKNYSMPNSHLILELHCNKIIDPISFNFKNLDNNIKEKVKQLKGQIKMMNTNSQNNKKYDLIYLYASPLVKNKGKEMDKPINYRDEIKYIINIFNTSKKYFNCLFEYANENIFNNFLMQKQTKILHIASHGDLEENTGNYYLILEDKGIQQNIKLDKLKNILKKNKTKLKNIDLVFVSTCHSETLGKLFLEYGVKNVIYIQGKTPISNIAALKFTEFFYEELIKGHNIKESFYKSQERIKLDKTILFYNPNNCCCSHKHKNNCKIKNQNSDRSIVHKEYHKKICDCNFDEYNIHKINCKLMQKIRENNNKYNFNIKEDPINKRVKICCCDEDIKHNEYSKFIFESNFDATPFKFQEKGIMKINKNCCVFEFDNNKNFSIIGRRKEMREIYDIISNNTNYNNNFIIIYGEKEIGKQDFAESVCVYLFERKIIYSYNIVEIKTKLDLDYLKYKLSNYNQNFQDIFKKIIILKISYSLDENKSLNLMNYILNEMNADNRNLYYILLLSYQNEKIEDNIKGKYKKIIHLQKLADDSARDLLQNLLDSYGYGNITNNLKFDLKKLFELVNYQPKKINLIAELICKGVNYEELIDIIKSKINEEKIAKNKFQQIIETKISKIYYLLSIMRNGLPYSIIKLIYPDYDEILMENKNNSFIYLDQSDNWYHINQKYKKEIDDYFNLKNNIKEECILNCLKVFARLLFFFIQKNKKNICFPDSNIHHIFNSYNDTGIWRTLDKQIYEYCFLNEIDKEEYENILINDFILERLKDNIIYFIEYNLKYIKILLKNNEIICQEYLDQILLMLPSAYFLKKGCKKLINKCIKISEELGLENGIKRLLLFLYSLEKNPKINLDEFSHSENELQAEAYFLEGLKNNNKQSFEKAIENYSNLKPSMEIKKKISCVYYELGALCYFEKNYEEAKIYLNKAKNISKEIGNYFIIYRCNIDLALILQKLSQGYVESTKLLSEVINQNPKNINNQKIKSYLVKEAYDLIINLKNNIEADIVMLNSNPLTNHCSALHSGIYAYLNNQYYILEQLYQKLKLNIKLKSIVLNKENLLESFNKEGEILIIQSDDFSNNGEIVMESDIGESELLSIEELQNLIPVKIKYKLVILCFIKSSKLINLFKDKVEYLITFDDINCYNLDYNTLIKYNELSIEFIINFIEKAFKLNILNSFNEAYNIFIKGLENCKNIKQKNYITLTRKSDLNISIILEKYKLSNKKHEELILYYPLINLPVHQRIKSYEDDIFNLICRIILKKQKFINVYLNNDNRIGIENSKKLTKKAKIGIEIMKFLYRHQSFNELYYVYNPQKYGKSLKEITYKIIKNNKNEEKTPKYEESSHAFILINNFEKIKSIKYQFEPLELLDNVQYLIMSSNEMIINKDENNNESETMYDKKYKNKIVINNSYIEIDKILLTKNSFKEKKIEKFKLDIKNNNYNKINNNIFKDFKSILSYSFDSDKNLSD